MWSNLLKLEYVIWVDGNSLQSVGNKEKKMFSPSTWYILMNFFEGTIFK